MLLMDSGSRNATRSKISEPSSERRSFVIFFSFQATLKLHSETMTQQKETISKLEERDREREDELRDAKEKVAALTTLVDEKVS